MPASTITGTSTGREDIAAAGDRVQRLERARRIGLVALLVELHDELLGRKLQVLRVVPQEPLRVHGAGEGLIVAVLERLEELLADARVGGGLLERDALLLTLSAKRLAEPRHLSPRLAGPSRTPHGTCLAHGQARRLRCAP